VVIVDPNKVEKFSVVTESEDTVTLDAVRLDPSNVENTVAFVFKELT